MNAFAQPLSGCELTPIPSTCSRVRRLMLATADLIGGHLETKPESWNPALEHTLLMPLAEIIVIGTRCSRPLLVREGRDLGALIACQALIVRAADKPCQATFDLLTHDLDRPFLGYRLWIGPLSGSSWLIPSAGEAVCIRLGTYGIELVNYLPYLDAAERDRGLRKANDFLSMAAKGWF